MSEPTSSNHRLSAGSVFWAGAVLLTIWLIAETVLYLRHGTYYGFGVSFLHNLRLEDQRDPAALFRARSFYPFGYNMLMALQYRLLGVHYDSHVLAGLVLYAAGMVCAGLCARRLFDSAWAGVGAMGVFLCLPGVVVYSKFLSPEGLMLPLVPLCVLMYLASDRLRSPLHGIALGLAMAVGFLTKWSYGAYVGPLFLAFGVDWAVALKRDRRSRLRRIAGMSAALAIFVGATLPWYAFVFDAADFKRTSGLDPYFFEYSYWANLGMMARYFLEMIGRRSWTVAAVLAMLAFVLSDWKQRKPALIVGILGVVVPLMIFASPPHLDHRYLLPVLPLAAIPLPGLIWGSRPFAARRWLSVAAAVLFLAMHFTAYLGLKDEPPTYETIMGPHFRGDLLWGDHKTADVLDLAKEEARTRFPDKSPLVVAGHPYWTDYHIWQNYLHYVIGADPDKYGDLEPTVEYYEFNKSLRADDDAKADIVLMDCGPDGDCINRNREYVDRFIKLDSEDRFTLVFSDRERGFTLGDLQYDLYLIREQYDLLRRIEYEPGNTVLIYVRRPKDSADDVDEQVEQDDPRPEYPVFRAVD